jgi:hypothetical protein
MDRESRRLETYLEQTIHGIKRARNYRSKSLESFCVSLSLSNSFDMVPPICFFYYNFISFGNNTAVESEDQTDFAHARRRERSYSTGLQE